MTDFIDLSWQ